jgi:hypothetical protein
MFGRRAVDAARLIAQMRHPVIAAGGFQRLVDKGCHLHADIDDCRAVRARSAVEVAQLVLRPAGRIDRARRHHDVHVVVRPVRALAVTVNAGGNGNAVLVDQPL